MMKPPLFDMPEKLIDSVDVKTILETAKDMRQAGIFIPPFEKLSIRISICSCFKIGFAINKGLYDRSIDKLLEELCEISRDKIFIIEYSDFRKKNGILGCKMDFELKENSDHNLQNFFSNLNEEELGAIGNYAFAILIVLLATKNIERRVVKNDARATSKRARDDAKHFSTTTYLNIGKITETCRGNTVSSSGPVRAHLRRGHIRLQRYGEGFKEVKKIFIQPVFVNADKEWIEKQKTYKFSGSYNSAKSDRLTTSEDGHNVQSAG
jgi:hypothetical protein